MFQRGIPFLWAWKCFKGAPISAKFQRPLLAQNSTPNASPAENISKQIPSWLTAPEEICSAAYNPSAGPSVKWNKTSTIYLLWGCIQPAPSPGTLRRTQCASVFVHRIWRARVQKGNFSKRCVGVALEIPCILLWKKETPYLHELWARPPTPDWGAERLKREAQPT